MTARIEVEAKADCFTLRFFVKNDSNEDVDVVIGAGGGGKKVALFDLVHGSDSIEITPPIFRRPVSRAMKPDKQSFPAHKEVLYDTYTIGFPQSELPRVPGGLRPQGAPKILGFVEFERWNDRRSRLRLRTAAFPFPVEALPKPHQ